MLTARVVLWRPVGTSPKEEEDIAVLKLEQDMPPDAQVVRLVRSDELWGHAFRVLGFPAGYDDGIWASGIWNRNIMKSNPHEESVPEIFQIKLDVLLS